MVTKQGRFNLRHILYQPDIWHSRGDLWTVFDRPEFHPFNTHYCQNSRKVLACLYYFSYTACKFARGCVDQFLEALLLIKYIERGIEVLH